MKAELKSELGYKKVIIFLSIFSIGFSVGVAFLGELLLPFAIASLAALYAYDSKSKYSVSVIVSAVVVLCGVLFTVFFATYTVVLCVGAVLLALIIKLCYEYKVSKAGTSLLMTFVTALTILLCLISIPMIASGSFSLETVRDFYSSLYDGLRQYFIDTAEQLVLVSPYESENIALSREDVALIFDSAVHTLLSVLIIASFAIVGIALKIFCAIISSCDKNTDYVRSWRFVTPNLYAYFFIALIILNLFASSSDSVFAIAMSNLYNVFTFVYAYAGLKLAYGHITKQRSKVFAVGVILFAVLFLSSFAVQILAILGLMHTFYLNKQTDSGASA